MSGRFHFVQPTRSKTPMPEMTAASWQALPLQSRRPSTVHMAATALRLAWTELTAAPCRNYRKSFCVSLFIS